MAEEAELRQKRDAEARVAAEHQAARTVMEALERKREEEMRVLQLMKERQEMELQRKLNAAALRVQCAWRRHHAQFTVHLKRQALRMKRLEVGLELLTRVNYMNLL